MSRVSLLSCIEEICLMKKVKIKTLEKLLVSVIFIASISYGNGCVAQGTVERLTLLEKQVDLPSEQVNSKVMRVKFSPGFKTPWHTHEGPGPRYVIKGELTVVENGKTNVYKSGDVFWETGALMSVENTGGEFAELLIFELDPVKK